MTIEKKSKKDIKKKSSNNTRTGKNSFSEEPLNNWIHENKTMKHEDTTSLLIGTNKQELGKITSNVYPKLNDPVYPLYQTKAENFLNFTDRIKPRTKPFIHSTNKTIERKYTTRIMLYTVA